MCIAHGGVRVCANSWGGGGGRRVPVTLSPPFSVRVVTFLFRKYSAGIIRRLAALTKLPKKVQSKKRYKHFNRCVADAES